MRIQSRRSTFSALVGIGVGALFAGLLLPFVVGDTVDDSVSTSAGNVEAGDVAATGGAPADDLDPVALEPSAAGVDGATSTATGDGPVVGLGARPPASGPTSAGARTASDVGVTAEEITLGFVLINVGPAAQLGTVVGIEVEQQRAAVQFLVDDLNRRGGIHGRRVKPAFAVWDVLDANSGRVACLELTEDAKAFAVIGSVFPPDVPCYTREHGTALQWICSGCPDSTFIEARGLIWASSLRGSRQMSAWVAELDRVSYLKTKKVGIVTDETNDPGAETAKQLSAAISRSGRQVVRMTRLSGDLQTGSSQIPVEVSQMNAAGAEAVFLIGNRLFATQFVQQADSQGWDPLWSTSEAGSLNVDTCCENMPASFDGTLGLTTAYDDAAPEPEPSKRCREFHDAKAEENLDERGSNEYSLTMVWCDYLGIFERAAVDAGPNLTRAGLDAAVQRLGALGPLAATMGGRFAPGKVDLEDFVRLQVWKFDCKCWRGAGPFHSAS